MERSLYTRLLIFVSLVTIGCAPDDGSSSWASTPHEAERCLVNGAGALPGGEAGSGSIEGGIAGATGSWLHDSATAGVLLGTADLLVCRINGSRIADFEGSAEVDGTPGYYYRAHIQDRGTPGDTVIVEGAPTVETLTATRYYRPSRSVDGALAITGDQARVTIPAELPVTEGAPGTGRADLTFVRADTGDTTRCRYYGNGSRARGGDRYVLRHCVGRSGSPEVVAGDVVDVLEMTLHVQSGDSHSFGCSAQTTISVDLDVVPITIEPSQPDVYELRVYAPDGSDYLSVGGPLVGGAFTVTEL